MGNAGSTPLHKAANEKNLQQLRWEVQQHPGLVNAQEQQMGWTPLHVAAFKGSDPIARELLARGALPDILDKEGRTALHLAALHGNAEVVRDLLRRGASTAVRDKKGASPYDYAIQKHPTIAALLGGPPPPPPLASPPPPPPAAAATAVPRIHLAAAAAPHQLLPPPPPSAAPVSMGIGGAAFPPVHHDRLPPNVALPPRPTTAPYPAGPTAAAAAVYEQPSAPPAPPAYGYGQGYGAAAPPPYQQQQPYTPAAGAPLPYPTVPGRQPAAAPPPQPPQPQPQAGGPSWPAAPAPGGGGAAAAGALPYRVPPPVRRPSPPPVAGGRTPSVDGGSAAADLDWAPAAAGDWGGEPDASPHAAPAGARRAGFNPAQSARFQLEKLLGAGLAHLGLGGPPRPPHPQPDTPGAAASGASVSGASAASSSLYSVTSASGGGGGGGGRLYGFEELRAATGGFSPLNKLGEGGYGPVYRGSLDGIPVAVKVMDSSEGALQGRAEFEAEVSILSRLHHPHIVLLIGSCPDKGMLVYELMTNSSLEAHLFGGGGAGGGGGGAPLLGRPPVPLGWRDRVRIAAEVASALLFLHSAPTPIVHMDLKPANVLLDEHLTAKLGDVGLARLAPSLAQPAGPAGAAVLAGGRSTVQDTRLVGTWQYIDPEYLRSGEYSARSDVYALGMVLLQLLTGREDAQVVSTVEAARQQPLGFGPCIDPRAGGWPAAEAVAFADLGLRCVEYRRQDRPDLRTVILPTLMQLKQRTLLYDPAEARPQPQQPVPGGGLPPMFLCPITQDVMDEPVVAADGYTYERLAIEEWVARSRTSPLTNMPLAHTQLVPNLTLRSAIKEWRMQQQQQQQRRPAAEAGW